MHPESVTDVRKFEKKIQEAGMNETAPKEAEKVLNRMKQEGENSHEYGMLYDYLDFVTTLSWKKEETVSIDLEEAEQILDEDHYGLKKIKERIIQQLAGHEAEKQTVGFYSAVCGPARNRQRPVSARASPGRWTEVCPDQSGRNPG